MVGVVKTLIESVQGVAIGITLMFLLGYFIFDEKMSEWITKVCFAYVYVDAIEHPIRTVFILLQKNILNNASDSLINMLIQVLDIMVLLGVYKLIGQHITKFFKEYRVLKRYYIWGIIIGFAGTGINAYALVLFKDDYVVLNTFMFILLAILTEMTYLLGVFVLFLGIVGMQYKKEVLLKEKYLEITREYYQNLESKMKEVRKIKHDMCQHLNTINYYIETNELGRAEKYIEDTEYAIASIGKVYDVGNELLNVTISHIQKQYGIALECSGRVNEKCKVIEGDICIIVSNLLTNAMEASTKLDSNERYIKMEFKEYIDKMTIHCENTYKGAIEIQTLGKFTSKTDAINHGLGISNIKDIVEKYDGEIVFDTNKGVFSVDIVI